MNFLACSGAITQSSTFVPICSSGWVVMTSEQVKEDLNITSQDTKLSAADTAELWGGLVLIMLVGFGIRLVRQSFFK